MRRRLLLLLPVLATVAVLPGSSRAAVSTAPCSLFDAVDRTESSLPAGMTLTTGREANLFPSGTPPQITLTSTNSGLSASWTVRDRSRVLLAAATSTTGAAQTLQLPSARPGLYQLELMVTSAGVPVGSACVRYGVTMPGARLDPSQLPAGKDWGGGGPQRDVALHDMLGVGVVRRGLSVSQYLTDPTYAMAEFTAAAQDAKDRGVAFVVQVGQGGQAERAAIADGTWASIVQRMATTYRGVVPYWEAWNEPNFDYFYPNTSGVDFARRTSIPFYRAVKAGDPAAKVVAGSAYGADVAWYTAFGKAGGFRYLDVLSVHPYCWGCAFESQVAPLKQVAALRDTYGGRGKPMWDTESGFKSTVDWGGPWTQADWTVRKLVWERSLNMRSNQFLLEGGWEDWSVIDFFRGVKPAAMALSAYDTVLRGRAFKGWTTAPTGIYAARFGPKPGGTDTVTVVWTTGRRLWLPLRTRHTTYDEMGVPSSVASRVIVDGSVRYLVSAPGQVL